MNGWVMVGPLTPHELLQQRILDLWVVHIHQINVEPRSDAEKEIGRGCLGNGKGLGVYRRTRPIIRHYTSL